MLFLIPPWMTISNRRIWHETCIRTIDQGSKPSRMGRAETHIGTDGSHARGRNLFRRFCRAVLRRKSYLINNLLRRDLLPLGTTETTPLLTYIRYGAHEEARLHYCDGAVQIISTKQVQELRQNSSAWELDKLEYLEIFLPEELLRQGMIFLDTPGVNTLIQRHQHLLNDSLSLASKVVYVSGHALSQPDTKILNMLASRGLDISFVRTHFDEIKTSEENPEDVRRNDCLLLGPYGLKPDDCYHLSNLPNSKWYEALDSLRQMLTEKGIHAQAELLHSVEVQLSALAQQCISTLEDRRTNLEALCARH